VVIRHLIFFNYVLPFLSAKRNLSVVPYQVFIFIFTVLSVYSPLVLGYEDSTHLFTSANNLAH
jgi:hypothetical protein